MLAHTRTIVLVGVLNAIVVSIAILVATAHSQPQPQAEPQFVRGVGIIAVQQGSSRQTIQAAIERAAQSRDVVLVAPGVYRVDRPIVMKPGVRIRGYGAKLIGTTDGGTIMTNAEGTVVEGFEFDASARNVTGIGGNWIRCQLRDCSFWTNLAIGVDATGLINVIERCAFGLAGAYNESPGGFRGLRVVDQGHAANFWKIRDSHFYHATGDHAIEFRNGYHLEISGCNIEKNRTTKTAVSLAGMYSVHLHDNWWEGNAGECSLELPHSDNRQIGSYVVNIHDEFINLNGDNNRYFVKNTWGATNIEFNNIAGTGFQGKGIAPDMSSLKVGRHHLVGYDEKKKE